MGEDLAGEDGQIKIPVCTNDGITSPKTETKTLPKLMFRQESMQRTSLLKNLTI